MAETTHRTNHINDTNSDSVNSDEKECDSDDNGNDSKDDDDNAKNDKGFNAGDGTDFA